MWDSFWVGANTAGTWIAENLMPVFQALADWWAKYGTGISEDGKKMWDALVGGVDLAKEKLIPFISETLQTLADWWTDNGPLISDFVGALADAFAIAIPIIINNISAYTPLLEGMVKVTLDLITMTMQLITGDWAGAWESAKNVVSDAATAIWDTLVNIAGATVELLGFEKNDFIAIWGDNWNQLKDIASQALDFMWTDYLGFFAKLGTGTGFDAVFESWSAAFDGMVGYATEGLTELYNTFIDFASKLGSAFGFGDNAPAPSAPTDDYGGTGCALGGSVRAGGSYVVGERGSEMFIPNTSGTVVPGGSGGGAINITLNYSPSVALGNRQEAESTLLPFILSGIRAAQANGLLATV
jgi:hypothetical protein